MTSANRSDERGGYECRDDDPVTEPIVLPVPRAPGETARDELATRAGRAGAATVSVAFRGAGLLGSVVRAGGQGAVRQVRQELASRAPSRALRLPASTDPVSPSRPRMPWLALTALLGCVVGVSGLALPLIDLGGVASLTLLDMPDVGMPLLGVFVLLSVLPVLDIVQRRTRWTAWLVVPAVLGALPVGLVVFAVPWLPRALHLLWEAAPDEVLETGTAPAALGAADLVLVVVACLAVVVRVRGRVGSRSGRR